LGTEYADDHLLLHVHVKLNDGRESTVDIDTLEIKGRIAAREYAALHA